MLELGLTLFYTILLLIVIYKWNFFKTKKLSKLFISALFLIKIGFGFLLFLVYYYYYGNNRFTSDAFRFFDDSLVIYDALYKHPIHYFKLLFGIDQNSPEIYEYIKTMNFWVKIHNHGIFNDNRTIIRINAIFDILSFGKYHVHTVFMCFLSLVGLMGIYKTFEHHFHRISYLHIMGVFFIPSLLFWGSGVLKEGVGILAVGIFIYTFFKLVNEQFSIRLMFVFLLSIGLLAMIKIYIITALLPVSLAFILTKKYAKLKPLLVYGMVLLLSVGMVFLAWKRLPQLDIIAKVNLKQSDFINLAKRSDAGSYFEIPKVDYNEPLTIIYTAPIAILNTIFRPYLWDANSPFMLFNALENMALFLLLITALFFKKKWKNIAQNEFLFLLFFVLLMYFFIGEITPVAGAIVRYKIIGWPFYSILVLLIFDQEKLLKTGQKIPLLNRFVSK